MLRFIVAIDKDVIKVYNDKLIQVLTENRVYYYLESRRGIC
jgi:hypothetical protein